VSKLQSTGKRILVVDDSPLVTKMLQARLGAAGFDVRSASDGLQALAVIKKWMPDLVISDVMMPKMDGRELCRTLRQQPETANLPILLLTAQGGVSEKVAGFEAGADDYMVEPYSFRELLARVRAVLRRRELNRGHVGPPNSRIVVGDIVVDRMAHQVWRAGRLMQLRQREFDVLCVLMENAGRAVPRDELLAEVWGADWVGNSRTLDVHIRWLREKVEDDPSAPRYIQTVRGYGHRFVDPAAAPADASKPMQRVTSRPPEPYVLDPERVVPLNGSGSFIRSSRPVPVAG